MAGCVGGSRIEAPGGSQWRAYRCALATSVGISVQLSAVIVIHDHGDVNLSLVKKKQKQKITKAS
jgi:hypothetical protein